MIPLLAFPKAPLEELIHGPVTADPVVRAPDADLIYGVSVVGDGGRIADKRLLAALRWRPGVRLDVAVAVGGTVTVTPRSDGQAIVTREGYFRIPYRQRRVACLFVGDQVLLLGHRGTGRLVVHPRATLDELCAASVNLAGAVRP